MLSTMHILLADDHVLFRDALIQFIKSLRSSWTVETTSNFDSAYKKLLKKTHYDLVMLDLRMPGMNGLDGLQKIRDEFPKQYISILSGVAEEHHVKQAMAIGARAYFPKTLSGKALVRAIELIVNSEQKFVPMDETGTRIMPAYFDDFSFITNNEKPLPDNFDDEKRIIQSLTNREKQVLHYLAQGLSNKEIAKDLGIEIATVKLHVSGVCKKLSVANRTQAAIMAHQHNLISAIK
jgi:two-component system, NarL family, nitrate/nitrite response regulator NarL